MNVVFHKNFKKQYKKLQAVQKKIDERLVLFRSNPFSPVLNNHALAGKYKKYRSINITGDLRALYEPIGKNTAFFITLGSHQELYE